MIDTMKRTLIKALTLGAVSGCAGAEPSGRSVNTVVINYTDRYIGDVTADGVWVGAADAYGGEGNRVQGLLAPSDANRAVVLKVKWFVGSIYNIEANSYTRTTVHEKTAQVEVARPYPPNPSYLVIHFFPDGHVEAELEADRPKRRIPPPPGYHR
jgi:hypothetical protein